MSTRALACALALFVSTACTTTTDPTADTSKELAGLDVMVPAGEDAMVESGKTQQLIANALYADDTRKDVTSDPAIVWSTSDPNVATVDAAGMTTALHPGTAKIAAAYKGSMGNVKLVIAP